MRALFGWRRRGEERRALSAYPMATLFHSNWIDSLDRFLTEWGLIKPRPRVDHSIAMEEIADLLHHTERQLNRARVQHLCEDISFTQLEALWQQKLQEVRLLLQKVPMEPRLLSSWPQKRVTQAVENWERLVQAISKRSLQVMDLCNLQGALEQVADAFFICARAERG
jgi:hypothetical protein